MTQAVTRLAIVFVSMVASAIVYGSDTSAIVKAFLYLLLLAYVGSAFVKEDGQ